MGRDSYLAGMISYSQTVVTHAVSQATGIVKPSEGLELAAYPDPASGDEPWAIGYGSTRLNGATVQPGDTCTLVQAEAELQIDLMEALSIVSDAVTVALNSDQLGALTSFVYNVGPGEEGVKDGFLVLKGGGPSSMLHLQNLGLTDQVADQFPLWVYADGKVMPGLVTRREMERAVYLGTLDVTGATAPASAVAAATATPPAAETIEEKIVDAFERAAHAIGLT